MTTALQPAQAPRDIRSLLVSDKVKSQIRLALPVHMSPDRMMRVALTAINKTPKLLDCTQESILSCLMQCSQYGVEPDGRHAHLIPYGNQCTLIIDYKGIVALVRRSGEVNDIYADVVCENDRFEFQKGRDRKLTHSYDLRQPRGDVIGVYSYVVPKEGADSFEIMSVDEVEAIRARSRSGKAGPWVSDWNEMAKKGLALNTPIPTPAGWARMERLAVGDEVFDMNGVATRVMAVSEIKHLPCYKVTFSNDDSIVCDHEHLWVASIGTNGAAFRKKHGWGTHSIAELFSAKQAGEVISVPVTGHLQTPDRDLPIDPWILGYWLGNGNHMHASVSCHRKNIPDIQQRILASKYKYKPGAVRLDPRSNGATIGIKGGFLLDLRAVGLLTNKHIPVEYFRASFEQRLALLHGLMDSDGHVDKSRGRASFGNTNKHLADGVFELAASLGEAVNQHEQQATGFGKTVTFHVVYWKPHHIPVSFPCKFANFQKRKLCLYRGIKSIEQVSSVPTRCIAVASETRTYLAGLSMIPTHNTVFRRHSKWLPFSAELQEKINSDGDFELEVAPAPAPAKPVFDAPPSRNNNIAPMPDPAPPTPTPPPEDNVPMETPQPTAPTPVPEPLPPTADAPKKERKAKAPTPAQLGPMANLIEAGVSFDDFTDWCVSTARWVKAKDWPSYADVPDTVWKALEYDRAGIAKCATIYGKTPEPVAATPDPEAN